MKIALPEVSAIKDKNGRRNETLKGTITLKKGKTEVDIPVVLPYHGVFFIKGNGKSVSLTEVWNSWLGEAIDIR